MAGKAVVFDEFVQGGLLDDADVTIKSARFETWDYRGKVPQPVLALHIKAVDNDGAESDEFLSAGELKYFVPHNDGKEAMSVGTQEKLNSNTNAVAFLLSLMNADTRGELASKLRTSSDISIIDGTRVHVVRKNQPKRSGIVQVEPVAGGNNRVPQRLEVEKVLSYPWEAAGTTAPAATTAAATSAPAVAAPVAAAGTGGFDVNGAAQSVLVQILGENGGTIKKSTIAGKVFNHPAVKEIPELVNRNAILGVIVKPEFYAAVGLKYDPATDMVSFG